MNTLIPYADKHFAHGQPTLAQLAACADQGVRTVINLRAPEEPVDFEEATEVAALGMHYVALPIAGAADLNGERVQQFGAALDEARSKGSVLIHCGSSNRVGALVALDEAFNRGASLQDALAQGRAAGLSALEPVVTALIEGKHLP